MAGVSYYELGSPTRVLTIPRNRAQRQFFSVAGQSGFDALVSDTFDFDSTNKFYPSIAEAVRDLYDEHGKTENQRIGVFAHSNAPSVPMYSGALTGTNMPTHLHLTGLQGGAIIEPGDETVRWDLGASKIDPSDTLNHIRIENMSLLCTGTTIWSGDSFYMKDSTILAGSSASLSCSYLKLENCRITGLATLGTGSGGTTVVLGGSCNLTRNATISGERLIIDGVGIIWGTSQSLTISGTVVHAHLLTPRDGFGSSGTTALTLTLTISTGTWGDVSWTQPKSQAIINAITTGPGVFNGSAWSWNHLGGTPSFLTGKALRSMRVAGQAVLNVQAGQLIVVGNEVVGQARLTGERGGSFTLSDALLELGAVNRCVLDVSLAPDPDAGQQPNTGVLCGASSANNWITAMGVNQYATPVSDLGTDNRINTEDTFVPAAGAGISESLMGDDADAGVADTFSRSDHTHGREDDWAVMAMGQVRAFSG